jgi:hypothetical protein
MSVQGAVVPDGQGRVRREISIQRLLEWAFADECAQIDFEDVGTLAQGYGAVGNAYRMAQRGALGCRIDGGGMSYPDPDADVVASAVATLPQGCGGRRMAVWIAELSRARMVPDVYIGGPRCIPVGWHQKRFEGRKAATEHVCWMSEIGPRKVKRFESRVCPVTYHPSLGMIAAARRDYLQWWSALLELRVNLGNYAGLSRWAVTEEMPVQQPWKAVSAKKC